MNFKKSQCFSVETSYLNMDLIYHRNIQKRILLLFTNVCNISFVRKVTHICTDGKGVRGGDGFMDLLWAAN